MIDAEAETQPVAPAVDGDLLCGDALVYRRGIGQGEGEEVETVGEARQLLAQVRGGEFGRSPESQGSKGRDHHNLGFTTLMAGGGIQGGITYGATDEIGLKAIDKPAHFRDIHTTILHQLGLNQDALSYLHLGRRERLTQIQGEVIKGILA